MPNLHDSLPNVEGHKEVVDNLQRELHTFLIHCQLHQGEDYVNGDHHHDKCINDGIDRRPVEAIEAGGLRGRGHRGQSILVSMLDVGALEGQEGAGPNQGGRGGGGRQCTVQYSIRMCTVCVSFLYNCNGRQLVNERQARKECSVHSLLVPSTYCMHG